MGRLLPLIEVSVNICAIVSDFTEIQGVCNDGDYYQNVFIYFTGKG